MNKLAADVKHLIKGEGYDIEVIGGEGNVLDLSVTLKEDQREFPIEIRDVLECNDISIVDNVGYTIGPTGIRRAMFSVKRTSDFSPAESYQEKLKKYLGEV